MELTTDEKKMFYENFKLYMKKYGDSYPEPILEYIYSTFGNDLIEKTRACIMNQIYAEIGLLPNEDNLYRAYLDLLKRNHDIETNILEVGGGFYPIMAKYIDEEQQTIGKGTITVYDPDLITNKLGNINLVKKEFTIEDDINNYDIIMGIMPCEATEMIVMKAAEAKIPFFIALCGCTHFYQPYSYYQPSAQMWHEHIYYTAKKMIDEKKELSIDFLDDQFDTPYPIISSYQKIKTL